MVRLLSNSRGQKNCPVKPLGLNKHHDWGSNSTGTTGSSLSTTLARALESRERSSCASAK